MREAERGAGVDALFLPLTVRGVVIPNRIVMAPMTRSRSPHGIPTAEVAAYYRRRAEGGTGLIIGEGAGVDHPAAIGAGPFREKDVPLLSGEQRLAGWTAVAAAAHAAGAAFMPQLWHMGAMRPSGTGPFPDAPSLSPSGSWGPTDRKRTVTDEFLSMPVHAPKAATETDIQEVVDAFARSAAFAMAAGADGVAIHGAHGYLIDTFLWPETNRRTDRYGPALADRSRLAAEIVTAIRTAIGDAAPIVFRFSQWKQQDVHDRIADTPAELEQVLGPLADAGVDIFDASVRFFDTPAFAGSTLNLAGWAKKVTGKRSMAVGGVSMAAGRVETRDGGATSNNLGRVIARLAAGEFDLIAVGRGHLADPEWAQTARAGGPFRAFERRHVEDLI